MLKTLIGIMALVLVLGFATGASADVISNLTAWFPCDDNAATTEVNEAVGNVDAALNVNTDQRDSTDRVFGTGSLIFNGSDSAIAPDNAAFRFDNSSFSISLWMKTEDTSADPLFKHTSGANYYLQMSTTMRWRINQGGTESQATANLALFTTGEWEHLCVVRNKEHMDGETPAPRIEIWHDGSLVGSVADVSGDLDNTNEMKFGIGLAGQLDDIGFYDCALTADEIAWVRDNGVGTPIPEPGTMILAGFGVLALLVARKRR